MKTRLLGEHNTRLLVGLAIFAVVVLPPSYAIYSYQGDDSIRASFVYLEALVLSLVLGALLVIFIGPGPDPAVAIRTKPYGWLNAVGDWLAAGFVIWVIVVLAINFGFEVVAGLRAAYAAFENLPRFSEFNRWLGTLSVFLGTGTGFILGTLWTRYGKHSTFGGRRLS